MVVRFFIYRAFHLGVGLLALSLKEANLAGIIASCPLFYVTYKMLIKAVVADAQEAMTIRSNKDKFLMLWKLKE